jgi:hypothetical protein
MEAHETKCVQVPCLTWRAHTPHTSRHESAEVVVHAPCRATARYFLQTYNAGILHHQRMAALMQLLLAAWILHKSDSSADTPPTT